MRLSPLSSAVLSGVTVGSLMLMAPAVSSSVATATGTTAGSTATDDCPVREYAMGLRYQQSAHAAAAQQQGWTLAEARLRKEVADHRRGEEDLAIVTDLDETVLDNSPLLARDLEACHTYTSWDTWSDWELEGEPTLTPGAARFFRYADRHGVAIYYVSDRFAENKVATMATLRELGLPQVSPEQVLLYGTSKEERRAVAEEDHEVVLLLGDSLPDFHDDFDGASAQEQEVLVAEHAGHFGRDWIMFPNATYGTWRKAPLEAWEQPLIQP
ncbi:5'-nucleotidase, lipoprotein e(P4) family [Nocardioides sp.]|uniref:5'-nucleotidase, lipoprotein e(P4) family n=1 Tax=Nocardioides sp. TaxID=35761 RepID=UPI002C942837|nr:HAD family acid phosphatase [Nocardioides sp.]HSX69018.1 HAD family acid phosphatase [Nocardioides sp.]